VEGSVGSRVQPVAHSSFDAWIKAYRPDENSANTTMTYYSRGANIAAILDAMIIKQYNGKKCLDNFMQLLYANYYEKLGRGFSENELEKELSSFLSRDMKPFFAKYINGTETPNFNSIFEPIGLGVEYIGVSRPSFGANFSQSGGMLTVSRIRSNSTAENGGLSVKDEIIGCNGYRVNQSDLDKVIDNLSVGQIFKLLVSRDNVLFELSFKMENYERPQFEVVPKNDGERSKLLEYWLRTDN
jgi:predicted metalloprotease with PDZ domain